MRTSSSFGQQPQTWSHGLPDTNYSDMSPPARSAPPVPPSTSADVLAAATVLRNGSNPRSRSVASEALFPPRNAPIPPATSQARPESMSRYAPTQSSAAAQERSGSGDDMRDPFATDMFFGSQSELSRRHRQASLAHANVDIQWGSDSSFNNAQPFVPPSNQRKEVAALERSRVKAVTDAFLETRQMLDSAETTRPSSPTPAHTSTGHQRTGSIGQVEEDEDFSPRKRRKSNFQDERDEHEPSPLSATTHNQVNRKPRITKHESPTPSSEPNQKRRKSGAASATTAKVTRENLTEEQKRENHIRSEQKRRTLIREGFEDLNQLVPGLRGGGFSKSAVLIMSAEWLENLLQGNEMLRQRLNALQNK